MGSGSCFPKQLCLGADQATRCLSLTGVAPRRMAAAAQGPAGRSGALDGAWPAGTSGSGAPRLSPGLGVAEE